jgi:hypothetical protein
MISHIPAALAQTMADRGVDVIRGKAAFEGPNQIRVGDRTLKAGHIVIATGSKPRRLPIPGAEHMIASDDILGEREQPKEVVFVGGGVIALELGHVYARAGTKVTILEVVPALLPASDADAVDRLVAESRRIGIQILTNAKVRCVERRNGHLQCGENEATLIIGENGYTWEREEGLSCRYSSGKARFDNTIPASTKTVGVWVFHIVAGCIRKPSEGAVRKYTQSFDMYVSKGTLWIENLRSDKKP